MEHRKESWLLSTQSKSRLKAETLTQFLINLMKERHTQWKSITQATEVMLNLSLLAKREKNIKAITRQKDPSSVSNSIILPQMLTFKINRKSHQDKLNLKDS